MISLKRACPEGWSPRRLLSLRFGTALLFVFALPSHADVGPGSLVWTGDPVVFSAPFTNNSQNPFPSATDTGMMTQGFCLNYTTYCFIDDFSETRPFTVTSPGTFLLSSSFSSSVFSGNCNPDECFPSAFLDFTYSNIVSVFPGVGSLVFSGSQSATGPVVPVPLPLGENPSIAFLSAQETHSEIISLDVGNYVLMDLGASIDARGPEPEVS